MTAGDWINSIMAIATVAMAGGTFYLAHVTRKLVEDTADGSKQADRHHQENLRPFCVIAFADANELHPFGVEFDPRTRRLGQLMAGADQVARPDVISVRGNLRNKGKGLAKDVLLYLNMRRGEGEADAYRLTRLVVVSGAVGAEEMIEIDISITEHDIMKVRDGAAWKPVQIFSAIAEDAYEIVVEYKDVFGNTFRTVHPRGIWTNPIPDTGDQAKRSEMIIRQNRPTPIFLTGRQAVRTPADLSPQASLPGELPQPGASLG